jgi:hypothetical protein
LLEKERISVVDNARIHGDGLRTGREERERRTSFCAENTLFMIATYCDAASGAAWMMRTRHWRGMAGFACAFARLMSVRR